MKTTLVRRNALNALAPLALVLCLAPQAPAAPPPPRSGAFVLSFGRAARKHAEIREFVESSGRFQQVVDELNATFALPARVRIVFGEGDDPEYDPNTKTITMNYEFVENVLDTFRSERGRRRDELGSDVLDVCEFVLYHEMGHALVDVYDLPVTGKEEDSVDSLATVMAVVTERQEVALAGVDLFASWADEREGFSQEDFQDEHSLDEQRIYSIVCWLYGSDPETFAELSEAAEFDEDRETRCEEEWRQKSSSWMRLLAPHLKSAR